MNAANLSSRPPCGAPRHRLGATLFDDFGGVLVREVPESRRVSRKRHCAIREVPGCGCMDFESGGT